MKIPYKLLIATNIYLLFSLATWAQATDSTTVINQSTTTTTTTTTQNKDVDDKPELRRVEFGIRYMPTFSSIDVNTYDGGVIEGSAKVSHGFGIMTAINLSKHVGVQAEVNYYEMSQKFTDRSLNYDLKINYLNIPVLLSLNTNKEAMVNLNLVAGPQFGLNVGSKFENNGNGNVDSTTAVVALRKGDVGLAYGAGLEFALNKSRSFRLDIGYRGFYGLVNMDASSNNQGTYNVIVSASRKTYGAYAGLTWRF